MSEKYRRKFKIYSAWNYQGETADLDLASEKGWQLVKPGFFSNRFVYNPDVRYRYQLDFQKVDDMGRYIETFREQGWEYIRSTFNGWHYFRKLYDPSLSEEDYMIYPDCESTKDMNRRWARVALIVTIVLALFAVFWGVMMIIKPKLPALIQLILFLIETAVLLRGSIIMFRSVSAGPRRGDSAFMTVFMGVLILGIIAIYISTVHRPRFQTSQRIETPEEAIVRDRWMDFDVEYPDFYYLDLTLSAEKPMTFEVLDDEDKPVFTETATHVDQKDICLKLKKGHYSYAISADSGFDLNCVIE